MKKSDSPSSNNRQKIVRTARQLYWHKGYTSTSMRSLANACGFEPSNIYNYFSSKEEVLYEVMREEQQNALDAISQIERKDYGPVERFRALILAAIQANLGQHRASGMSFDTELKHLKPKHLEHITELRDAAEKVIREAIVDGVNAGVFSKVDEKMASIMIASMFLRARFWYSSKGRLTPEEIAHFITEFCLHGLMSEKS